jgi:colicin import membrane protein
MDTKVTKTLDASAALGQRLKDARDKAGKEQTESAIVAGYKTNSPLSNIEKGKKGIAVAKAEKLAVHYGTTLEALLGDFLSAQVAKDEAEAVAMKQAAKEKRKARKEAEKAKKAAEKAAAVKPEGETPAQ